MLNTFACKVVSNLVPEIIEALNYVEIIAGVGKIHDVFRNLFRGGIDVSAETDNVLGSGLNDKILTLFELLSFFSLFFFFINNFCYSSFFVSSFLICLCNSIGCSCDSSDFLGISSFGSGNKIFDGICCSSICSLSSLFNYNGIAGSCSISAIASVSVLLAASCENSSCECGNQQICDESLLNKS